MCRNLDQCVCGPKLRRQNRYNHDGFALERCRETDALGLVHIHDAQPRCMNIDGHELDLEDSTNKSAVVEREGGGKKEKTYDSSGLSGASFSHEGSSERDCE